MRGLDRKDSPLVDVGTLWESLQLKVPRTIAANISPDVACILLATATQDCSGGAEEALGAADNHEVLDVHAPHLVGLGAGGMSHGRLADPRQGVEACEEGLGLFGLR
eukprot:scaffold302056_cov28-Tisochrysis_lutea.AAC.3